MLQIFPLYYHKLISLHEHDLHQLSGLNEQYYSAFFAKSKQLADLFKTLLVTNNTFIYLFK